MYRKILLAFMVALALAGAAVAADVRSDKRFFSREKLQVHTGTATVNSATVNYANWQPLLTITPDGQHALQSVKIVIDLNQATTGFGAVYTSGTITASLARKVDGTNRRIANNLATATVSGSTASGATGSLSLELDAGSVGPTEALELVIKISSVSDTNVTIPYVIYYSSGVPALVTPAS